MAFTPQTSYKIAAYASGSAGMVDVEVDGTGNYTPRPSFCTSPTPSRPSWAMVRYAARDGQPLNGLGML
jgi:hypothetical protein